MCLKEDALLAIRDTGTGDVTIPIKIQKPEDSGIKDAKASFEVSVEVGPQPVQFSKSNKENIITLSAYNEFGFEDASQVGVYLDKEYAEDADIFISNEGIKEEA